jgi:hypothetical protein
VCDSFSLYVKLQGKQEAHIMLLNHDGNEEAGVYASTSDVGMYEIFLLDDDSYNPMFESVPAGFWYKVSMTVLNNSKYDVTISGIGVDFIESKTATFRDGSFDMINSLDLYNQSELVSKPLYFDDISNLNDTPAPEPGTMVLMLMGLGGLLVKKVKLVFVN